MTRRLRSLLRCPCRRCRHERRYGADYEQPKMTMPEAIAVIERWTAANPGSGVVAGTGWRDATLALARNWPLSKPPDELA